MLRTPPPHINSSEDILSHITPHTLVQHRTNKQPFLISYLYKVDAKLHHHYIPFVTLTQHTSFLQLHLSTHYVVTSGFVDRLRWGNGYAGQMDGEAGWWTASGEMGLLH